MLAILASSIKSLSVLLQFTICGFGCVSGRIPFGVSPEGAYFGGKEGF